MKKIINIFLVLIFIGYLSSCQKMDSTFKEFVVVNGLKYPQRPDSLKVFPGYNKLRMTWLKAKDPSVRYAVVYWNNYYDSLKVDMGTMQDTVKVDIDSLTEGTYTLFVKTFDDKGNSSVPSEVTGTSYGDNYLLQVTDRTFSSALRDESLNGQITWNNKTTDLVYSEVRYKTNSGAIKTVRILPDQMTSILKDIKPKENFEYRSVFLPANGIDSVARDWKTSDKPFLYKYPKTNWTAQSRNGNHDWGDGGGGEPFRVIDNNLSTGWHSRVGTPLPQVLVVDMKQSLWVDNIVIYPPSPLNWRYLNNVDIYLTSTPIIADVPQESWGKPIAKVQYPGGDKFTINFNTPAMGQYLALVFLDSKAAPNTYISFMEVDVYGY